MVGPGFEASPVLRDTLKLVVAGACAMRNTEPQPGWPGSPILHWAHVLFASVWGPSIPTPFVSGPPRAAPYGGLAQPPPGSPVGKQGPPLLGSCGLLSHSPPGGAGGIPAGVRPRLPASPSFQKASILTFFLPHAAPAATLAGRGPPWVSLTPPRSEKHAKTWEPMHKGPVSPKENSGPTAGGKRALLSRAGRLTGTIRQPRGSWATGAAWPALSPTHRLLRGLRLTGRNCRCPLGVR